jgi:XTP/dITP diphosphohydrolase
VLCLVAPEGERFFEGRVAGTLVGRPRGAAGFGYDPIFVPEGHARTFAEMTAAEKHAISHRRRALDAFLAAIAAR